MSNLLTFCHLVFFSGCHEPVLPCLQTMWPELFHENANIRRLCLHQKWPVFESKNKRSVSELFTGFIEYYAERFNFKEWAVSVRTGKVVMKKCCRAFRSPSNCANDWPHLGVEEPYERTNAARSVHNPVVWANILRVFRESNIQLKQNKDFKSLLYVNGRYNNYIHG